MRGARRSCFVCCGASPHRKPITTDVVLMRQRGFSRSGQARDLHDRGNGFPGACTARRAADPDRRPQSAACPQRGWSPWRWGEGYSWILPSHFSHRPLRQGAPLVYCLVRGPSAAAAEERLHREFFRANAPLPGNSDTGAGGRSVTRSTIDRGELSNALCRGNALPPHHLRCVPSCTRTQRPRRA